MTLHWAITIEEYTIFDLNRLGGVRDRTETRCFEMGFSGDLCQKQIPIF